MENTNVYLKITPLGGYMSESCRKAMEEPEMKLENVGGCWVVGEKVTVRINGKEITRTVFNTREDLAIRYQNKTYWANEFEG